MTFAMARQVIVERARSFRISPSDDGGLAVKLARQTET
jgi:hypothetical protein